MIKAHQGIRKKTPVSLDAWCLELLWGLDVGIWSFPAQFLVMSPKLGGRGFWEGVNEVIFEPASTACYANAH